jgi:hypothetical protein
MRSRPATACYMASNDAGTEHLITCPYILRDNITPLSLFHVTREKLNSG